VVRCRASVRRVHSILSSHVPFVHLFIHQSFIFISLTLTLIFIPSPLSCFPQSKSDNSGNSLTFVILTRLLCGVDSGQRVRQREGSCQHFTAHITSLLTLPTCSPHTHFGFFPSIITVLRVLLCCYSSREKRRLFSSPSPRRIALSALPLYRQPSSVHPPTSPTR